MTAAHIVDPARLLGEALAEASPDLMRSLLQTMINALLSADADAVLGAEYGRPSPGRMAQRNGYRHRDLDSLSKSQVSRMAAELDEHVEQFRHRPWMPLARSPSSQPTL